MSEVSNVLIVQPGGAAYAPGGCAYGAIQEIEAALELQPNAMTNRTTVGWGGGYLTDEDELSIKGLIRSQKPELIVLIAFAENDGNGRLRKNTKRLSLFVPFGLEDDTSWPKPVRSFYIEEDGTDGPLTWREVLIEEAV